MTPPVMRAAVVRGPRAVDVVEVATPEPGPGQVLVALEGSGICGSELPVWEGRPWFTYPLEPGAPGHEGWGTIQAVGEGVDPARRGQRVAVISQRAHAQFDVAPADAVVALPAELEGRAFPGEAVGCAFNVFARAGIRAGETVAVVGIGFLGAIVAQLAKRAGANVIAISRRPFALDVARAGGADEVLASDDPAGVVSRVTELTAGRLCECVVEAVGRQEALDLAGRLGGVRSRLVVAGYHQDGHRTVDMQSWNWRGLDVINAHERDPAAYVRGVEQGAAAVARGELDLDRLITHSLPLDALDEALRLGHERPEGFLKVVVRS